MIKKAGKKFNQKAKLDSILTSSFRKYAENELGELDTAASFMYLYNRFGKPNYDNRDEYKILYDYRLVYRDLFVSVHASYHSHVLFDLFVKKSMLKQEREKWTKNCDSICKRLNKIGVAYFDDLFFDNTFKDKKLALSNMRIVDEKWANFFPPEHEKFDDMSKDDKWQ